MAGYIGSGASVVSSGVENKKVFDITTNTTSLTGLNYTVGKVHVYHNGVRLVDGTDFTANNSTSITLTVAAVSGDQVVVVSFASFQLSEHYTKAEADAEFVNDPNEVITVDGDNVGIGTSSPVNNNNRTTLGLQGAWGGQLDIMVGSTVHAQFGTDNFGSGQSCRIQSQDGIVFKPNGTERMRIDSSGRVTKPNQPAFLVTKSGDQTNLSTGYNDITWQNETYDVGSNFTSNTFTAPVTGKYLLRANLSLKDQPSNASWYILRINTSNRLYMNSQSTGHWNGNASSFLKTLAATVVVDMDANDTASIMYYQYQGTTQADVVANADYTFFSGILLS